MGAHGPAAVNTRYDVVIIGAGFAGLSAGAALAAGGARVLVLEARAQLGGRATAFRDRQTGEAVDNGQHVLFGCYRESLAFLRRIGAEGHVRMQPSLELVSYDRAGRRSMLRCPRLPPPLHLLAGVLGWSALPLQDRLSVVRVAGAVLRARRQLAGRGTVSVDPPGATVQDWLAHHRQGPALQEWLWHPLAVAALNQPPEHAAADAFVRIVAEMFGPDPAAAAVVLPLRPLDQMYAEPARAYIEARGGAVRTSAVARLHVRGGAVAHVSVREERYQPARVIAAVPWFGLRALLGPEPVPELREIQRAAAAMAPMPIVTVNLWYDRPVMDEAFAGLPGRSMQWVFDKRLVFGTAASHLSLVSSGASHLVGHTQDALVALAAGEVRGALPRARGLDPVRATVVREKQATFSLAPGQPARPGPRTAVNNLILAGDWTDTGLPATIEGAVVSGHRAAACAAASA